LATGGTACNANSMQCCLQYQSHHPSNCLRRLLANLYNGNVYLWNYNDTVSLHIQQLVQGTSSNGHVSCLM
jgi:hypothetical protein